MKYTLFAFFTLFNLSLTTAQPTDSLAIPLTEVVVTANRVEKSLAQVGVPVQLISATDIQDRSRIRLNDLLAEMPNIQIKNFLGEGIQIQGLDADYTLILLDGEPLIGRNGGTLDLSRVDLGNVERIEVVRGASSSLYGSEAMGGVINIITKKPNRSEGFSTFRYGSSRNFYTLNGFGLAKENRYVQAQYSYNRSDGYDIGFDGVDPIAAPFKDQMARLKMGWGIAEAQLNFATSIQNSLSNYTNVIHELDEEKMDWNAAFSLKPKLGMGKNLSWKNYISRFENNILLTEQQTNILAEETKFNQFLAKSEIQYDRLLSLNRFLNVGMGAYQESVLSTRIATERKFANGGFIFAQYAFKPKPQTEWTVGARLDQNGVYALAFSPKISVAHQIKPKTIFRASLGRGFKAPTFQQNYLTFNNPAIGYAVFGAQNIAEGLLNLTAAGQIQTLLVDPNSLGTLKPEYGNALNVGLDFPFKKAQLNTNIFYNDIQNLIETAPVAIKTNNAQVFSYFNLNRVFTRGLETEWKAQNWSVGYTFLSTGDYEVLQKIRKGELFTVDETGTVRRMKRLDYGGLMNRSKHLFTGKIKKEIQFKNPKYNFETHFLGRYTGRYGLEDVNGNLVLDDNREYVKGYFMFNLNLQKDIGKTGIFSLGIDNLFNTTRQNIPHLRGRTWFTQVALRF